MKRVLALAAALLFAAACGRDEAPVPKGAPPAGVLRILAGSEIRDLEPLKPAMERAAGTKIEFIYSGSLEAVEKLEAGEKYDAVWLSHGKYLQQTPELKPRIRASERIMTSPVVMGLRASKARALGWDKTDPTWAQIVRAAADGKLSYGMTNPATSNTGFTALVGVASALADKQDALTIADIKTDELRKLFRGQKLVAGSSGWLAEAFVRDQDRLDGMVNYESVILSLQAEGKLREPLVPIYPKEGIVTADYPLMLLEESRRASYDPLVKHLRSPEVQREITQRTLRRPVLPEVDPAPAIPKRTLAELPFPASREVLDALIDAYQGELRRPASTYFVIDTSGSMKGQGIDQLRGALLALSGADASISGRFARFQPRERIYLMTFSTQPHPPMRVELPAGREQAARALDGVRDLAQGLRADGSTAIFSSVKVALEAAMADRTKAPERVYSVVIMTDGVNESGMPESEFTRWYGTIGEADRGIPVFGLLFGNAQKKQLETIAQLTGGRVLDARKGLGTAFKEIRGYQ